MSLNNLIESEDQLVTSMGKAFLCERTVFRGKDLHHELGNLDWFQLYFYSITGRILNEKESKLLNYYWVATSYPDPSIWPNHVASLAGSVRSTASLSLMAGLSISEASIYGRRPERRALDFFYRTGKSLENGDTLEQIVAAELVKNKTIYGYGRPLAKIDERVPHTLKLVAELGLNKGKYLKIALELYNYLKRTKGLSMNIAAIDAALAADMGLNAEEYQLFMTPCFIAGIVPCYIDAREKPEGSFFPVRCSSILNKDTNRRHWD